MDSPANDSKFVVCRCQNCDGHIEFDASDFQKGEARKADCPHCHLETLISVPVPTKITATPANPNPSAMKAKPNQKEFFTIKLTGRAVAIFFALTTLCLALILTRQEMALNRAETANAVLAAQLKQLQNSQQVQNSQFQRPQTIIVRPESQGQHWQRMGLNP